MRSILRAVPTAMAAAGPRQGQALLSLARAASMLLANCQPEGPWPAATAAAGLDALAEVLLQHPSAIKACDMGALCCPPYPAPACGRASVAVACDPCTTGLPAKHPRQH